MNRRKNLDVKLSKPKTGKGNNGNPPLKRYNIKLKTAADVRRMLSVTLNDLRQGNVEVPIARTLIYGGQVLLNVFQQTSFEERLRTLEERFRYGGE
jgi:hypothetical protein